MGFGATFAITQTIAAVGFPIIILLLIPFRTFVLPRWFSDEELRVLDAPTASPFTMISVGGNFGESLEDLDGIGVQRSGEETAVPSGSEGMLVGGDNGGDNGGDSDEGAAERGEGPGMGMKRRESWRGEGRSGRWAEGRSGRLGESIEMQKPGVSRRSVSRQSK